MENYLELFSAKVGEDVRQVQLDVGNIAALKTYDKDNLTKAINEICTFLGIDYSDPNEDPGGSGGSSTLAKIDDTVIVTDKVWSSSKIDSVITQTIADLINGAPEALDTLKELSEAIQNDEASITSILTRLSSLETAPPSLILGETSTTAYRGDYGKIAYEHALVAHAPVSAQKNSDITKAEIEARLTGSIESHSHAAINISTDSDHLFVSVSEKSSWDAKSNLQLGITSSTAFRGDLGNLAYDHSTAAHAPHTAQKNSDITKAEIEAKLTGEVSSHSHLASGVTTDSDHLFVTDIEKAYWSGKSNLELGEVFTTAYRGDRGKVAYEHSLVAHAPASAQKNSDITKAEIEAKLTGTVTSHDHGLAQLDIATQAEVDLGEDDTKVVTPKKLVTHIGIDPLLVMNDYIDGLLENAEQAVIDPNVIYATNFPSNITVAEVQALEGVTGNIQAQLDSMGSPELTKAAVEAVLTGEIDSHTHKTTNNISTDAYCGRAGTIFMEFGIIDCGNADTVYLPTQIISGGNASGV